MTHCILWLNDDLVLQITVQPKSSRDTLIGIYNERFKVCITAPPENGKANKHLIRYLAKQFHVANRQVVIEKGLSSRHKQIRIASPTVIPAVFQQLTDFRKRNQT